MLENDVIQARGFHNTSDPNGVPVGFQFRLRTKYYKGLWLSQLRVGDVTVDGDVYTAEQQIWEINGENYTVTQMLGTGDADESTYWQVTDAATVKLAKPGGLAQGYHDLAVEFGWVPNYVSPAFFQDKELGINFLGYRHEKRLLIV